MMRSKQVFSVLALLILAGVSAGNAQAPAKLSADDAKEIDATLNLVATSLTAMDFKTFATVWTDDCDFVNVVGMHWKGKAQVVKAHSIIFTTRYHGYPEHTLEETAEQIAPGVALVVTTVKMDDYTAQDGKRMTDNLSRLTWVLIRQDGKWMIRSGHNTTIDLQAARHDPALAPAR